MNINTILEPLHEIEVLGAVGNNLPDFCPDIHPQTEADVKTAVNMDIVISVCTLSCVSPYRGALSLRYVANTMR